MRVKDLIEVLETCNPDARIMIKTEDETYESLYLHQYEETVELAR